MPEMTQTNGMFRVEDISFKRARRQSEVAKEIAAENSVSGDTNTPVKVPVSLTPEQVKTFYEAKTKDTQDMREKRVYEQTIRWIDELLDTKKKLVALEMKQVVSNDDGNESL